jgi:hypothetical protein
MLAAARRGWVGPFPVLGFARPRTPTLWRSQDRPDGPMTGTPTSILSPCHSGAAAVTGAWRGE